MTRPQQTKKSGPAAGAQDIIREFRLHFKPNYIPQDDEEAMFRAAFSNQIPLIIKGPTGCGKTRFIEHMACEENTHLGISTFAISTEENSRADMEIMFPHRRFAILPDIVRLPQVLPRLYVRLTA